MDEESETYDSRYYTSAYDFYENKLIAGEITVEDFLYIVGLKPFGIN